MCLLSIELFAIVRFLTRHASSFVFNIKLPPNQLEKRLLLELIFPISTHFVFHKIPVVDSIELSRVAI